MNKTKSSKKLSSEQREELLGALKARFEKNMNPVSYTHLTLPTILRV